MYLGRMTTCLIGLIVFVGCGANQKSGKNRSGQQNGYTNPYQNNGQPQYANQNFNTQPHSQNSYVPPQSAEVERVGNIIRERVSFTGVQGDRVPAYLYLPSQPMNKKLPVLMLQYGLGGDKSDGKIAEVAQAIVNDGWSIIVIDIHGVGERSNGQQNQSNSQQIMQFLNNFNAQSFERYVGDYKKTVDYIASRPELDSSRIAYGGASWGAITGTSFVAAEPRIKAFVSIVGGGGFFGALPSAYDPAQALAQIAPRPVYLINASQDEVIIPAFSQALHNVSGNNIKKRWIEANHTLDGVDLQSLASDIVDFLSQSLGVSPNS